MIGILKCLILNINGIRISRIDLINFDCLNEEDRVRNSIKLTAYSITLYAYRVLHLPKFIGNWAIIGMLKLGGE